MEMRTGLHVSSVSRASNLISNENDGTIAIRHVRGKSLCVMSLSLRIRAECCCRSPSFFFAPILTFADADVT